MSQSLLSCADAIALVQEKTRGLRGRTGMESVALERVCGRVLASDILADRDQPPFHRSTRDGYAVRAADAGPRRLVGAIRAGEVWTGTPLSTGEAIEIMTGAPMPEGADAIVMVEHVSLEGGVLHVEPGRSLRPGENFVPRGAEARAGDVVLRSGTRMRAAEVALAASVGGDTLRVFAEPAVAVLSTGDELVAVHETPGPMQIRNSNAPGLAAMMREHGGVPLVLPPARDTRASLRESIAAARDAEMLVLTGGVSAGKYDLVEDALLEFGAEFFFTGVRMQPGKPAVFGRIPAGGGHAEQWIFGLPGNPVSTQVTALLFAMPMLRALSGEQHTAPSFAQAILAEAVAVRPGLTRFLPARMESSVSGATVRPTGWQGSGDLHSNARANCYVVVPPEAESLPEGATATVLLRSAV